MITEADLHRLETILRSHPGGAPMSLSMIDGMLTAAVIGPRFVAPPEIVPWVFDREGGARLPPSMGHAELRETFGTIIEMQNRIAGGLDRSPSEFVPLFLVHTDWSYVEWVDGFDVGMGFAIEHWDAATKARTDLWGPIVSFGDPKLREIVGDDWHEVVASLSAGVIGFRDYFRGETRAEFLAAHTPHVRKGAKVGRNDPCPCGSGRKYKKCCGSSGEAVH
jgi:uncharacterized protein